jgi:1-deoxy-D-xylulose-5-phosphate reductoisomerase
MKLRTVSIFGATGSIGASTIDLVMRHADRYAVEVVTGNARVPELAELARKVSAKLAVVADPGRYEELRLALSGSGIEVAAGPEALVEAASRRVDWVMAGIVGAAGLPSTFAAARTGAAIALANKESLVCAGSLLTAEISRAGGVLLPADSEHNAIFQAIHGTMDRTVDEIILTASGGPFRTASIEAMRIATPQTALKHPIWSMGAKISIDSATLVNKGLELIEAHHLFGLPSAKLGVLVHPQSIVHGLVRFCDGSLLAQLGPADMRVPIASCLAWPDRIATGAKPLDLAAVGSLQFELPDVSRFPALRLARVAMDQGGGLPCVLNAANEVAVAAFLGRGIGFLDIAALIEQTMEDAERTGLTRAPHDLEDVIFLDGEARKLAVTLLPRFSSN